jgi:hypothetical protein
MYDIEGKLKRRAMLERLEGLGRAAEATSKAVVAPDLPTASMPAVPSAPGQTASTPVPAMSAMPSTSSQAPVQGPRHRRRPRQRNEPVVEPTPTTSFAAPVPRSEPVTLVEPVTLIDTPASEPVIERQASPPDDLSLHYGQIDAVSAAPGADRYAPHQPAGPEPSTDAPGAGSPGNSVLVVPEPSEAADPTDPTDPADPASSAATIADLLRHGAGRLFFESRPPTP